MIKSPFGQMFVCQWKEYTCSHAADIHSEMCLTIDKNVTNQPETFLSLSLRSFINDNDHFSHIYECFPCISD